MLTGFTRTGLRAAAAAITALVVTVCSTTTARADLELQDVWPAGACESVASDGDLVVYGFGSHLGVADATDPAAPEPLATLRLSDPVRDIALAGGRAYVALGAGGLAVVDLGDPARPVLLTTVPIAADVNSVTVRGDLAYLGAGVLRVLDLADPAAPVEIAPSEPTVAAARTTVHGGLLFTVDLHRGLAIYDLAAPRDPVLIGSHTTYSSRRYVDVVAQGDRVYVAAGNNGVWVFDVSDPTAPLEIAGGNNFITDWALRLALVDENLWVSGVEGIVTFTLTPSPQALISAGRLRGVTAGKGLCAGSRPAVTDPQHGVVLLDASGPYAPAAVGRLETPGVPVDVALDGDTAWVARGGRGLVSLDLAAAGAPQPAGELASLRADAVVVDGGRAYVVGNGLSVIDIGDPAAPVALGWVDVPRVRHVAVAGDRAYLCGGNVALAVVDVGDPTAPEVLATVRGPALSWHTGVTCTDGIAFSVHQPEMWYPSLEVFDVADPGGPVRLGVQELDEGYGLAATDSLVFIAARTLLVLDVSAPALPVEIGRLDGPPWCVDIALAGDRVYLAASPIVACDVSSPEAPLRTGEHPASGGVRAVAAAGGRVAVVDDRTGLLLLRDTTWPVPTPRAPVAALGVHPNPFNPRAHLTWQQGVTGRTRVEIFDLRGRRIARVLDEERGPGPQATTWDGRDGAGRPVPSGQYLARLQAGGRVLTRKLVLAR